MSDSIPSLGIDFGTTNSSMAWYDPRNGCAEVIKNAEGEDKTPSLVYFGEGETLVGRPVETMIEDASNDLTQREEVFRRTISSIKRDLLSPPRIALPGGLFVRPVDVAAEILKKLKRDAEGGHYHEEVSRAVITCPAEFSVLQRQQIEQAGHLAGFSEVVLLEEPVAGALSYARAGLGVGRHVLVYDLGGGTFDLAVLDNEDESFHVAMEPKGMERCGGDDFDLALYYHCEEVAQEKLGRSISLTDKKDLKFLHRCRRRKENLTSRERETFSDYLSSDNGPVRFEHQVDREKFHELINEYIETTVRLTEEILKQADTGDHEVDTVVLIGGSSRVRLVDRRLSETLPVKPLGYDKRDVAVALGAAHYTHIQWPGETVTSPGDPALLDQYREAVETIRGKKLNKVEVDRLDAYANQLGLSRKQALNTERQVLGDSVEGILYGQYDRAVEMVWADGKLNELEVEWLAKLANEMSLDNVWVASREREIMGTTKEKILHRPRRTGPLEGTEADFSPAFALTGHSDAVRSVAFSPDGQFLLSGAADHTVRGWDTRAGRSVGALAGHQGEVRSVVFSPDGELVASGGFDKTIRVWKLPKGEPFHRFNHPEWVFCVAISSDSRLLAGGGADAKIGLWSLETGEELSTLVGHSHWVLALTFSPDGRSLVSGGADGTVRVWDMRTGKPLHTFEHPHWMTSVAFDPGGDLIASGGEDGAIRVWNPDTGELMRTIIGHPAPVRSVAFSSDGRLLFSGGADTKIKAWLPRTGEPLNVLSGHSEEVGSVTVSPDGQLLASGGYDKAIRIWRREGPEQQDFKRTTARLPYPGVNLPSDEPGDLEGDRWQSTVAQYRDAVIGTFTSTRDDMFARTRERTSEAKDRLSNLIGQLGLRPDQAANIEREVMGDTKEDVFKEAKQHKENSFRSTTPEDLPVESKRPPEKPLDLPD